MGAQLPRAAHAALTVASEPTSEPTFGELRRAARSVKRAELGGAVLRALRPRKLNVVFRSRAPLALQLKLAHLDGRLIWRSEDTFVLVKPPIAAKVKRSAQARVIHVLDNWWDAWVLGVPGSFCLLVAVVLGLVFNLLVPALLAILAAVSWVLVLVGLVALVVSLGRTFSPSPARVTKRVGEAFLGDNWSITVCHVADPGEVEGLVEEAVRLVDRLSGRYEYAADKVLVCSPDAASTPVTLRALRDCARVRSFGEKGWDLLLVRDPGRTPSPPSGTVNGVPLLLLGSVVILLFNAQFVAEWETKACATACTGGPTSFGDAVFWLVRHYVVVGIPGAAPATLPSTGVALMMPFMGAVVLLNVVMVARGTMRKARDTKLIPRVWRALESPR
ncbi:hypothetical protein [Saccharothrix deserti]|uniref:hypothetical protein n=1 Tax=Saccharothrix deserti TaxID=2593674 RepID=UPI00131AD3D4|nr:hypothetical protein [Saccharothrix deserti]